LSVIAPSVVASRFTKPQSKREKAGSADRIVHGDKELVEKLVRNDLHLCGSGEECCLKVRRF
jgi:hypothetical protein